jgi:N-acetylglucosaminyldiphosphoundecaprenol N-acetyl-beta-D-mannosaminyltransferase
MSITVQTTTSRVDVLGVHVSAVNPSTVLEQIDRWVTEDAREYVCVSDVNAILRASEDPELRRIHNESGLTLPDGVPLVWAGRAAGFPDMARVCGPDLTPAVLELAARRGWSSYFIGGADGVARTLADNMTARFPGLRVAGVMSPPFRPLTAQEDQAIVDEINDSEADLVWVGLGAPKQERWMSEHRSRLKAPVLLGVGAAFDMHAGGVRRAPAWMQQSGLEWSFRLAQEPRRLWRRYVFNIPRFMASVAYQRPRPVAAPTAD